MRRSLARLLGFTDLAQSCGACTSRIIRSREPLALIGENGAVPPSMVEGVATSPSSWVCLDLERRGWGAEGR